LQKLLSQYQTRVNEALNEQLQHYASQANAPTKFFAAINYSTMNQGKRIRPALIYAIADALNLKLNKVDSSACAIELIHSYSLVHDDLPAMDDDDLRRGKPTCHIQFDEATAILVGDAQQSLAFQLLAEDQEINPKHAVELINLLTQAAGPNGMIAGQVNDMAAEGLSIELEALKRLHLMKTGALIQCALLMGAAQSDQYKQLRPGLVKLGENIGLAFQVHDDILDIEGDTKVLGKPQGSDAERDKSTYPKLLGLEQAKSYRDSLITSAKAQLVELNLNSPFLEQLIDYIAQRKH